MTEKSDMPRLSAVSKSALWWLLAASLTLNILVAGVLVGTYIGGGWDGGTRHHWRKGGLSWLTSFADTLPSERKKALAELLAKPRESLEALNKELDAARKSVRKIIRIEPFNDDAFKIAVERVYEIRTTAQRITTDAFIATVGAMTIEERQAFASRRRKHLRNHKRE